MLIFYKPRIRCSSQNKYSTTTLNFTYVAGNDSHKLKYTLNIYKVAGMCGNC